MITTGNILPKIRKSILRSFENDNAGIWTASKTADHATGVLVFTTPALSVMVPAKGAMASPVFT